MRLMDVRFKTGSIVKDVGIGLLGLLVSFDSEKLTDADWEKVKQDFEYTGIEHVPYDNKTILFEDVSNANDVVIARVLMQHGAVEPKDFLSIEQLFVKNFCLYLHTFMTGTFRAQHAALASTLENYSQIGITPATVRQIPQLFKLLPAEGIALHNNHKFDEEYALFREALKDTYCGHLQPFLQNASMKVMLQALSRNLTDGQIAEIQDKDIKNAFDILHRIPPEVAFRIIDFINPTFPDIKISDNLLGIYTGNRRDTIAATLQPSYYVPQESETYQTLSFKEKVAASRNNNKSESVLL